MPTTDSAPLPFKEKIRVLVVGSLLVGALVALGFGYRQLSGQDAGGPCHSSFDCKPSAVCLEKTTCRKSCSDDADCPAAQRCKELIIERSGRRETPLFGTPRACL